MHKTNQYATAVTTERDLKDLTQRSHHATFFGSSNKHEMPQQRGLKDKDRREASDYATSG